MAPGSINRSRPINRQDLGPPLRGPPKTPSCAYSPLFSIQTAAQDSNWHHHTWQPLNGTDGWSFRIKHDKSLQRRFFGSDYLSKLRQSHPDTHRASLLRWMAADVATSIPLGPDRILWLFGDTLVYKNVSLSQFTEVPSGLAAFPRQSIGMLRSESSLVFP